MDQSLEKPLAAKDSLLKTGQPISIWQTLT